MTHTLYPSGSVQDGSSFMRWSDYVNAGMPSGKLRWVGDAAYWAASMLPRHLRAVKGVEDVLGSDCLAAYAELCGPTAATLPPFQKRYEFWQSIISATVLLRLGRKGLRVESVGPISRVGRAAQAPAERQEAAQTPPAAEVDVPF